MATFSDVFLPDTVVIRSDVSPDGQVITCILQNMLVQFDAATTAVQPGESLSEPALSAVRTLALFAPLKGNEAQLTVQVKLQGAVDLDPNARAVLVTRCAGNTFVDDLTASSASGGNYELIHAVNLGPKIGFFVTLILLVDRDWVNAKAPGAVASVHLMELSFQPPSSGAKSTPGA